MLGSCSGFTRTMAARASHFWRLLQTRAATSRPLERAVNTLTLSSKTISESPPPLRIWRQLLFSQTPAGNNTCSGDSTQARGFLNSPRTFISSASYSTQSPALSTAGLPRKSLWDHTKISGLQQISLWGAGTQQVRQVMVDVVRDDLERAMRKMKRRLKDDNGIRLLRERQYFRKPSELKVLARKERDKRVMKKAFKEKLRWIMNRRSRGF